MTSLAFMLVEVPDPVWNTSTGNWSSWSPASDCVGGGGDAARPVLVEQPELGVDCGGSGLDAGQASG